jgi:hypothetical protein
MSDVPTDLVVLKPTTAFRWYDRYDKEAWINEGKDRRICTLQQYWQNVTGKGLQGEWRDVPTEVEPRG